MKLNSLLQISGMSIAMNACAATWDQLPELDGIEQVELKTVKKEFEAHHPWKHGTPLPKSFEDAGLTIPVSLIIATLYFDGGSRCYVFQGANGKYLTFCTDAADYVGKNNKLEHVTVPRIFLGTFHFSQQPRTVVPVNSDTERFLLAALAAEVPHQQDAQKK